MICFVKSTSSCVRERGEPSLSCVREGQSLLCVREGRLGGNCDIISVVKLYLITPFNKTFVEHMCCWL